MKNFAPDYRNIEMAALNLTPHRIPLYEHIITTPIMEQICNKSFEHLIQGDEADVREFFRIYTTFFRDMGYDTVSYECCIGEVMPDSGALGGHRPGVIKNREDFEKYPFDEVPDRFFEVFSHRFRLLGEVMPEGMKAVGGPGNGVFESVQEIVGYTQLCYMSFDDPELYADLFNRVGEMMATIWKRFLEEFGDIYTVCRFGDDLGFKNQTLLSAEDIKIHIVPQYAKVVSLVHAHKKPFLLHSCGKIFDVMDEIIDVAKIDAKHSNEDQIAPFQEWVDCYGDRIGNFGGVDMNVLYQCNEQEIKSYVKDIIRRAMGHKGFALGSGNSIPPYVPVEGFLAMIEAANEMRL